jgi:hypothetical protein
MSASKEWTEWHLTPRGWERGTEKVDGVGELRPRPADAVMTNTYRELQSDSHAPVHKTSTPTWRSADTATIETLLKQFGAPPETL